MEQESRSRKQGRVSQVPYFSQYLSASIASLSLAGSLAASLQQLGGSVWLSMLSTWHWQDGRGGMAGEGCQGMVVHTFF